MCETPLERIINGPIKGEFISCRGAISTQQAHPTAIAVPVVEC